MGYLDNLGKRDECVTDLILDHHPFREPWRCASCEKLIYNLDGNGRPAPGAPLPKYGGPDHKEVCSVCFQMKLTLDSSIYWKSLHDVWKSNQKGSDKLRPGNDYFAS